MSLTTYTIRSASSPDQASAFWWPMMQSLSWNRALADLPVHYHAAGNGKNWLLLTPSSPSPTPPTTSPSISLSSPPTAQGCIVAFTYANATAWVAFFIVEGALRGQGHGGRLWSEMENILQAAGAEFVGLDGVEEQVGTYERRGFVRHSSIAVMTRESLASLPVHDEDDTTDKYEYEMKDIQTIPRAQLASLDKAHTGLDRSAYWLTSPLLDRPDVTGYASLSSGSLTGFILVRASEEGYRLGPLYASDAACASRLLRCAMRGLKGKKGGLVVEVFEGNVWAMGIFESEGWRFEGVRYARMWRGGRVPVEQREGGTAEKGMWAILDACAG